jgi:hypothetical protein
MKLKKFKVVFRDKNSNRVVQIYECECYLRTAALVDALLKYPDLESDKYNAKVTELP